MWTASGRRCGRSVGFTRRAAMGIFPQRVVFCFMTAFVPRMGPMQSTEFLAGRIAAAVRSLYALERTGRIATTEALIQLTLSIRELRAAQADLRHYANQAVMPEGTRASLSRLAPTCFITTDYNAV